MYPTFSFSSLSLSYFSSPLLSLSLSCCLRTNFPSFLLFSFPFASSSLSLFILHVTSTLLFPYLYNFQSFLVVLTFKRSSFLIPTYFSFFFCISFISSSFPFRFRYFPILTYIFFLLFLPPLTPVQACQIFA
jgi:hypothetical protein